MFDFLKKIKDKVLDKKPDSEKIEPQISSELPEEKVLQEELIPETIEETVLSDESQPELIVDQEFKFEVVSESIKEKNIEGYATSEASEVIDIFEEPSLEPYVEQEVQPEHNFEILEADIFEEPESGFYEEQRIQETSILESTLDIDIFIESDSELIVEHNVNIISTPESIETIDIFEEPDSEPFGDREFQDDDILEIPEANIFEEPEHEFFEEKAIQEDLIAESAVTIDIFEESEQESFHKQHYYEELSSETPVITDLSGELQSEIQKDHNIQNEPVAETVEKFDNIEDTERPKGWFGLTFSNLKDKIARTSESLIESVLSITSGKEILDDDVLDEMEERLIKADLGLELSVSIIDKLRNNILNVKPDQLKEYFKSEFSQILLAGNQDINLKYVPGQVNIYLITGVNGVGKTTLIGKLAYRFKEQGKKVLVAAGDTFRAAAEEQLNIWSNRAGAEIIRNDGADPASVVFDAIIKAKKDNFDVLLVDTAGRLHNKANLMEELRKIKRTVDKNAEGYLAESILVLDATTGQNGLQQAKVFTEAVQLSSVALTKLDGSAKGGIIIAIAAEMNLPVKLVGVGEEIDDLRDFDPVVFIEALFN